MKQMNVCECGSATKTIFGMKMHCRIMHGRPSPLIRKIRASHAKDRRNQEWKRVQKFMKKEAAGFLDSFSKALDRTTQAMGGVAQALDGLKNPG